MKFSYSLIKKFVPEIKSKQQLVEALTLHSFEAEEGPADTFEVNIPPNRFSDAASHWGIAKEAAAVLSLSLKFSISDFQSSRARNSKRPKNFKVSVEDKNSCPRYTAQYFENIKVKPSPSWMQKILKDCGLRPINNVVDIMNYVMLEIGQPLHAFDYDRLSNPSRMISNESQIHLNNIQDNSIKIKKIIVRRAKKGEKITTLEDKTYELNEDVLVIVDGFEKNLREKFAKDSRNVLAIAGLKGGKGPEVSNKTSRIIVESANFEPASIYKTSKALNLITDASLRFSHGLSPALAIIGLNRAAALLEEIAGVKRGEQFDSLIKPLPAKILKFNIFEFNRFIGLDLNERKAEKFLHRLGFKRLKGSEWQIPAWRLDIENHQDLAEEVIRLFGYNQLKSTPPLIYLSPSGFEDLIVLRDKIKKTLVGLGLDEIYNYSFISEKDLNLGHSWGKEVLELENPLSSQFKYLRPSLAAGLLKNIEENFRFFEEIKIFEIGKIFFKIDKNINEKNALGIVLFSKIKNKEPFFELKGVIKELFRQIGLADYIITEADKSDWLRDFTSGYLIPPTVLKIESNGKIIGYLGKVKNKNLKAETALAELIFDDLLRFVEEEYGYEPLPKYPAVIRDISFLVDYFQKIGEIMQSIKNVSRSLIDNVDFVDEFDVREKVGGKIKEDKTKTRSLTFRIVFQTPSRTLTKEEVDKEMKKIILMLRQKFKAEIR